jgi:hypothetical protein
VFDTESNRRLVQTCPVLLSDQGTLRAVKLLHTAFWLFFVSCILGIWLAAAQERLAWGAGLSVVVLLECAVLAANRGRCPLTNVARHYSSDPRPNFDIYLPLWLARYNKWVFGVLFVLAEVYLVLRGSRLLP